ncbi:MAG: TonB-dependent receptor [Bacteroidota bacterium]|nr:TonB-dependent receptor [Bacteroidota bacterium]MDP4273464.1 TonB-dependent receptor [Bacteroidota bacterium]
MKLTFLFSFAGVFTLLASSYSKSEGLVSIKNRVPVENVNSFFAAKMTGYSVLLQQHKITGTLTDAEGNPLPGVSVVIKGTTKGTMTDDNGQYSLTVEDKDATVVFSMIGFSSQSIKVGNKTKIDIKLLEEAKKLSEVLVVGYGVQRKATLTGAVSEVEGKDLAQTPVANISSMLIGRTSGVSGVQASGEPGQNEATIHIRGISTLNGQDPLIVIDGIQQPAEQPYVLLNAMDAHEIESISVLKDASATAVYGIRGANGVIIITTKRGKLNKPSFSFTANEGFTKAVSLLQTINSYQFGLLRNEAIQNAQTFGDHSYDNLYFSADELWKFQNNRDYTPAEVAGMSLTDAEKAELNNSPALYYTSHNYYKDQFDGIGKQKQYNLNVSGGTEKVKYFTSLGYFNQQGILTHTSYGGSNTNADYKRYNFRSNFDIDVIKNLHMSFNLAGQSSASTYPGANNSGNDIGNRYQNIIQNILESSPFSGPGIVDGHLVTGFIGVGGDATNPIGSKGGGGATPLAQLLTAGTRTYYVTTLSANLSLKHSMNYLTKGLSAKASFAYDDSYTKGYEKINSVPQYSAMRNPSNPNEIIFIGGSESPTYTADNVDNSSWRKIYLEASLNYDRTFGGHTVTGLVLGNAQKYTSNGMSYNTPSGLMGLVGRATYNFKERYLAEINLGYNGTEQFAKNNRFGFFPAYSAGWIVTNESWFPKNKYVTLIKFRASYGEVGNDQLNSRRYLYLPNTWAYSGYGYYFGNSNGSSVNPYYTPAQETALGNPNVTWERARKTNIAGDFKFINDKLSVTTAIFNEKRDNILVTLGTIPCTYGVSSGNVPPANVGKVSNKGFELEAGWNDAIGNFSYFIKSNFSFAKNKIEYEAEAPYPYPWMNATGYSIGQYKGLITDGYYNSQEELGNRPYNTFGNNAKLGDLKFRDINGDGIIDNKDIVPIGYSNVPEIAYNFNIGFSYKGFDVNALIIGTAKGSFPQNGYILGTPFAKNVGEVLQYAYDGHWTADKYAKGEKISYPEISFSGGAPNNTFSDFWLKSNDFRRLKNLEIGYTFSKQAGFIKRAGINSFRLYVNGNNLITWGSKLATGIDPEMADTGKNNMGYLYPVTKTFNIGANITF